MKHTILIFTLAIILRLIVIIELLQSQFLHGAGGSATDMLTYWLQATDNNWPPREAFYFQPLMPYYFRLSFQLFGQTPLAPQYFNALLGSLTCVLLYWAGQNLFGKTVGLLAGYGWAIYWESVFWVAILLDVTTSTFSIIFVLWVLTKSPNTLLTVLGGLVLALGGLGRGQILPIGFGVLLAYAWQGQLRQAKLFVLAVAIVLLPIVTRNCYYGSCGLNTATMDNLWIGNHPDAPGYFVNLEMYSPDWAGYILKNPYIFLEVMFNKFKCWLIFGSYNEPSNINLYDHSKPSILLAILPGYYALASLLILLLGHSFLIDDFAIFKYRKLAYLAVLYVPYTVATLIFFVTVRYRVPVMPLVLLFVAFLAKEKMSTLTNYLYPLKTLCGIPQPRLEL